MVGVINGRPTSFRSAQEAVSWALRTGMSKNAAAAAVSIPSQLLPQSQVSTLQQQPPSSSSSGQAPPPPVFGAPRAADAAASSSSSLGVIAEAGASSSEAGASPWGAPPLPSSSAGAPPLVWRTPLLQTHKFWTGWYQGLSAAFLKCPAPKMLLLAGTDRLDKELTIGQMQGRFQLQVMPQAGHAIHEDEPLKAAEHLLAFLKRFRIGEPPMVLPRAPPGMRPVLPVAAGPLLAAAAAAPPPATAADPRSR